MPLNMAFDLTTLDDMSEHSWECTSCRRTHGGEATPVIWVWSQVDHANLDDIAEKLAGWPVSGFPDWSGFAWCGRIACWESIVQEYGDGTFCTCDRCSKIIQEWSYE